MKRPAVNVSALPALTLLALVWASQSAAAPAPTELRPWTEYRTIIWTGDSAYKKPEKLPLFFQRLREMSINTGMVYGGADPQPLLDAKFPYYVENLVNGGLCLKFNSKVTDWDKFVTAWAAEGRAEDGLIRDYCLDDPQWLGWARNEMRLIVDRNKAHQPVAYNIRDELSTTISANPFDYDFNPITLEAFRSWLKPQYPDLKSLNAEWQTSFGTWEAVKPFTTDQIKNRMASGEASPHGKPDWAEVQKLRFEANTARQSPTRWNFAPWADFRTYMDISLARALDELRKVAHESDPQTPVGIEGTQMPHAFGGYDLWRLAQGLDWVEPYDIGNAREILGSFMQGKPLMTTVFEKDTQQAQRRLWHLLLEGDRGCLIWWSEDCIDWQSPDYRLTPKATALAPVLREMTSPLAKLFLNAKREYDPIFIHYSQPSIQVDWLLESTVDGSTWLRRFSSFEAEHNQMRKVRDSWLKALQDVGYAPRFISTEQVEGGELEQAESGVVVLPSSWSLSEKEVSALQTWLAPNPGKSRVVLCNGAPGTFDAHARLRVQGLPPPFNLTQENAAGVAASLSGAGLQGALPGRIGSYAADRLKPGGAQEMVGWLAKQVGFLHPEITLSADARVRMHRFRTRRGQLLAFERNIDYQMSEDLKQAGGNEALEKPVELRVSLRRPRHVYDLRAGRYLGLAQELNFTLNPWSPSLFALAEEKLPADSIISALSE